MSSTHLYPWIDKSIPRVKVHESKGGHRQKLFADILSVLLRKVRDQFIGSIKWYIVYSHADEMEIANAVSSIEDRLNGLRNAKRMATVLVTVPTILKLYIADRHHWFQDYIDRNLGSIYDCFRGDVANDMCSIKPLGSDEPTG